MKQNNMTPEEMNQLVCLAVEGDALALESLLTNIQDTVFNLSLRMLGLLEDAQDATQDILIKIMTKLSTYRKESSFTTWVYRIAVNYLIDYKKSMFSRHPLSFEFYGMNIERGGTDECVYSYDDVEANLLAEELKMSCSNVMLQCLDARDRCIFILGTMFKLDSQLAGEVLDMSPENYRQRLCRIRKKVGDFLSNYCGESKTGMCSCKRRVPYAISTKRLDPKQLSFMNMKVLEEEQLLACKDNMEQLDQLSLLFEGLPQYKMPESAKQFIDRLMDSVQMKNIQNI